MELRWVLGDWVVSAATTDIDAEDVEVWAEGLHPALTDAGWPVVGLTGALRADPVLVAEAAALILDGPTGTQVATGVRFQPGNGCTTSDDREVVDRLEAGDGGTIEVVTVTRCLPGTGLLSVEGVPSDARRIAAGATAPR